MGMEDILKQHLDDLYGDWTMMPRSDPQHPYYQEPCQFYLKSSLPKEEPKDTQRPKKAKPSEIRHTKSFKAKYRSVYGNGKNHLGTKPNYKRCCAEVPCELGTRQCCHSNGYGPNKAYCEVHDPRNPKTREAKKALARQKRKNQRFYEKFFAEKERKHEEKYSKPSTEYVPKRDYLTDRQLYQIQHANWMHEDRADTQADIADAIGVSVHEFQKTTAGCY